MTPLDFDYMAGMLKQRSGLIITRDKQYLLESRLIPLARKRGLGGLDDLVKKIRAGGDEALLRDVTEAMTTNESFFFRDNKPFDIFKAETLPTFLKSRADRRQIKIWSAACSTGQEAYSLAMILREEQAKMAGWRVEITGTDLSSEVLEKAKVGLYSQFEVQRGLPIQMLIKYFQQVNEMWQIDASLRAMVRYRQFNLLDDLGALGSFDIIFCRNVLIYFDNETKAKVLERMAKIMPKDGVLFLGGAETVLGVTERFKPVQGQRGVYALA